MSQLRHFYPAFRELNAEVLAIAAVGLKPLTAFARELELPFEHNFGHGPEHLSSVLCSLNLLAFLIHTLLHLVDKLYRLLRETLAVRQTFFNDLRALTRYMLFESWEALFRFMAEGLELTLPKETVVLP